MPTDLRARVSIDDKVLEAISELKKDKGHKGTVEFLRGQGHDVNQSILHNIQYGVQDTIPYELYLDLVGIKGAEEIPWGEIRFKESSYLARRIAYWHCFFFNIKKGAFAKQVVREAEMYGLKYSLSKIEGILFFDDERKRVEPAITDIVAKMFNTAASNNRPYSLNQIEDLVNYFDSIYDGEKDPNTVSWSIAEPVVDALLRLTGKSFHALMNRVSRVKFERGGTTGRKVTVNQYSALVRQLQELPQYRLMQVLNGDNILRSIIARDAPSEYVPAISGLTGEELQLIREGNKIYGEAFMQHIFPAYIAIKQEHGFPAEYFEWVVRFPSGEKTGKKYKPSEVISEVPTRIVADAVGRGLSYYKNIFDINASRGHKMSVTADGLVQRLKEARTQITEYASQHLVDLDRYRNSSRLRRP